MRCSWLLCVLVSVMARAQAEDNAKGKKWAVLVAGSSGYNNYGDQSDIYHAYQVVHRNGIPDENIIMMIYDDIANDPQNPTPGKVFNKPNGTDVYKGVKKDYVKDQVTPENFLAVLGSPPAGMEAVKGKILESGPNDHVLILLTDHGSSNLVCFPNSNLYADQLVNALKSMHKKKMFKKLLIYVDTCFSGSMFAGKLPNNIDVVAVSASGPNEVAWFTYCDIDGQPCYGGLFGTGWMEKVDTEASSVFEKETVNDFYKAEVKHCHNGLVTSTVRETSHPKMYGQKKLAQDLFKDFIGDDPNPETRVRDMTPVYEGNIVSAQDAYLHFLNKRIERANNAEELQELQTQKSMLLEGREMIDELFSNIMSRVEDTYDEVSTRSVLYMQEMPCYRTLVENFKQQCVNVNKNTYALRHLGKLANLCATDNFSPQHVVDLFSTECTEQHRQLDRVN